MVIHVRETQCFFSMSIRDGFVHHVGEYFPILTLKEAGIMSDWRNFVVKDE